MKLSELAENTFAVIEQGRPDVEITGAAGLDIAGPGEVTFLANPKYTPQISTTRAGAIFLRDGETIDRADIAVLRAKDPYLAYTRALRLFNPEPEAASFVHPSAVIDASARVAPDAHISANVVIGKNCAVGSKTRILPNVTVYDGAQVGSNCVIHSGVSIRENCEIGNYCTIHNNTTIGSDGFGYARTEEKRWLKIPQTGRVVIEDDVEIGANTAIDCASVGETRILRGTKIDNLVQIGHSCTIEEDSLICAQTGLAGSSVIGKRVILAGQVGIAGHLKVGDDVVVTAKSATSHNVENGKIISGIPAFDNRDWLRSIAAFRRLGEIARAVRDLEKRLGVFESKDQDS
jgi:UDP-3-O-[3-hydroxymyristoyl] glucosamine N-acyltransferase